MGVLDSSYIRTVVVMSPGRKIIFWFLSDTPMDLVVEHWNAQLKQRLAALGGRYTEESIERIGASLNLASLLESKLYPTYMERLELFFAHVFFSEF